MSKNPEKKTNTKVPYKAIVASTIIFAGGIIHPIQQLPSGEDIF